MQIDDLVTALNAGTTVPFVRDAWVEAPSTDYGVVCLDGQDTPLRGDDRIIIQPARCSVYFYSRDGKDEKSSTINSLLNSVSDIKGSDREYMPDLNMIRWVWQVRIEHYFG